MLLTSLDEDLKSAQFSAVHQLTHAAFYSPRPWIYEGVAHFAQVLYRERESGREAALDLLGLHRTAVAEAEKAVAVEHLQATDSRSRAKDLAREDSQAKNSLINTSIEEFYRGKAMYVWWMLREMIGENALKRSLAAYRADADTAPAYLQHLIEAESKRDLQWFFDDWVYRDRGLPDFRLASVHSRRMEGTNYIVTLTVENTGDAGAEVQITLKLEDGQVAKKLEVHGKSLGIIRMEAASAPVEATVNDGSVPESDTSNNVYKIGSSAKE